jgi:hypothetical protein
MKKSNPRKEYQHEWYLQHRASHLLRGKDWRLKNKDANKKYFADRRVTHAAKLKEEHHKYYILHKREISEKYSVYRIKNKERRNSKQREYRLSHKQQLLVRWKAYVHTRRKIDENFRTRLLLRSRLWWALHKQQIFKTNDMKVDYQSIISFLGNRPDNTHLWEIDHIVPLASFDLTDANQRAIAFSPSNHQWLTREENRRKSDKVL